MKKEINANDDTIVNNVILNPWDKSNLGKELFEKVKSGFEIYAGLSYECFWEEENMKYYLLCPTPIKVPEDEFVAYFHFAYSMIFGYFQIDDGFRKYKFYANESTFLQILENIFLYGDRDRHENDFYAEVCQYAECLIKYEIVDHFKKEHNIKNGFCCPECECRLDENSFSAIVESNPGIESFIEEKFINCPICGSKIPLNKQKQDMLHSYETIYRFHCFSEQILDNEFQLKFIANLLFNKNESGFLKNLELEKISDPLCQELFGISKSEFDRIWCLFRINIHNHVYYAVKNFIFYEDDRNHAEYIESKRAEALRYMRRKN
jgi:hypothetical protein